MSKLDVKALFRGALRRLVHPRHLWGAWRAARRGRTYRTERDPRLALYAELLPGGFLNYGYHEDLDRPPEQLSLHDMQQAQRRYGEQIVAELNGVQGPVLDVGCGMGGLIRLLKDRGFAVTGLTPDELQIVYLRKHLDGVPLIHSKFENLDPDALERPFGAIVTSESLQYLKLERAIPLADRVLADGGRWVACDFFRKRPDVSGSGHVWNEFVAAFEHGRFRIARERDITAHVAPSLAFITMWARKLGMPLLSMLISDLERKRPGTHYLLADGLAELQGRSSELLDEVDPECFGRDRTYRLLVIERR